MSTFYNVSNVYDRGIICVLKQLLKGLFTVPSIYSEADTVYSKSISGLFNFEGTTLENLSLWLPKCNLVIAFQLEHLMRFLLTDATFSNGNEVYGNWLLTRRKTNRQAQNLRWIRRDYKAQL